MMVLLPYRSSIVTLTIKYEETGTNFEGVYLNDGLTDSAKIEMEGAREFPQQKWLILSSHYQATDA